jgi:hypothetical protein
MDIRDDIAVCPTCHVAVLRDHPQYIEQLKCPTCGYACDKKRKPNAFGYYPPTPKPADKKPVSGG